MQVMRFDFIEVEPKVRQALYNALGQHIAVGTEEVDYGRVFVKVISPQFNGLSERKRQDAVWDAISSLGSEAQAVSLVLALAPTKYDWRTKLVPKICMVSSDGVVTIPAATD